MQLEKQSTKAAFEYRYFCVACTGRAFYSVEPTEFNQITCQNCGAICTYDANNWFRITDADELRRVNG